MGAQDFAAASELYASSGDINALVARAQMASELDRVEYIGQPCCRLSLPAIRRDYETEHAAGVLL